MTTSNFRILNFLFKQCFRIGWLLLLFWQADLVRVCLQEYPAMHTLAHAADTMGGHKFANNHGYNSRTSVPKRNPTQGAAIGGAGHGGTRRPAGIQSHAVCSPKNHVSRGRQGSGLRHKSHLGRIRINGGHTSKPMNMNTIHIHKSKHKKYIDGLPFGHHSATAKSVSAGNETSGNGEHIQPLSFTVPTQYEKAIVLAVNPDTSTLKSIENQGLQVKRSLSFSHLGMMVTAFEVPAGEDAANAVSRLQEKGTARIMLNQYYRLDAAQEKINDISDSPDTLGNWPLSCLSCVKGIRVGMVDSYVDTSLTPLARQQIIRKAFASGAKEMSSDHGTAIAELLVGYRNNHFSGLLPDATLFAAAAFSETNNDAPKATVLAIIKSLDWLVSKKVQVINLSFSGPDNDILALAIQKILEKGIPVVAAAGNRGQKGPPAYPGAYGGVIAVTAIDKFLRPYREANQGEYISFAAPGVRVPIPCHDEKVCYKSGTSFAAPYYTALIAMHLPQGDKTNPIQTILSSLKKDAIDLGAPGKDPVFGWGLVQCDQERHHKKQ